MTHSPSSSASAVRVAAWRRLSTLRRATGPTGLEAEDLNLGDQRARAQASRLVRGVLRHLSLIDAYLERGQLFDPQKTPTAIRWVLRLAIFEKIFQTSVPDYAIGAQTVELARQVGGDRAGRFANAIMRRLLPEIPDSLEALDRDPFRASLPDPLRWSIPQPIADALGEGYGSQEVRPVLEALSTQEAPVWLRVNTLKSNREQVAGDLLAEGVETRPWSPAPADALQWISGSRLPWETEPWRRGELTVQDAGAMFAAWLLDPAPGSAVLDLCAAPGGKTGQLWERMERRGRLSALEINPQRRAELRQTLTRLYGVNHGIELPDCEAIANFQRPAQFDRVLIDAPCQALGLIGRHPEIRWDERLRHQAAMQASQRQILDQGAKFVKPGGRLLWVTCSPTVAENEGVVAPWLEANPGWWVMDPADRLQATEWGGLLQLREGIVRTRPDRLACDGFAMILIERLRAS